MVGASALLSGCALLQVSSTGPTYTCDSLLAPDSAGPVEPLAPGATPHLGITTEDLGRQHVDTGTTADYGYCPPASGPHYNLGGGRAPLTRQFYPPSTTLAPGTWVHNLEHGYVVLLYKGEPSPEIQQQLRQVMDEATASGFAASNCGANKVIAVRFDDMDPGVDFAAVAWDRVLLLDAFDKASLLTFADQWQDGPQVPEQGLC